MMRRAHIAVTSCMMRNRRPLVAQPSPWRRLGIDWTGTCVVSLDSTSCTLIYLLRWWHMQETAVLQCAYGMVKLVKSIQKTLSLHSICWSPPRRWNS